MGTYEFNSAAYGIGRILPGKLYAGSNTRQTDQPVRSEEGQKKDWCGIGTGTPFFDVDGRKYPCPFVTPMTFTETELAEIMKTDFANQELFVDNDCFNNCYIYPICPTCSGANYLCNRTFKKRNKTKCKIQKLISVFIADLTARRIVKNPEMYDDAQRYYTIEAIKKYGDGPKGSMLMWSLFGRMFFPDA
jgi:hypothetical protein